MTSLLTLFPNNEINAQEIDNTFSNKFKNSTEHLNNVIKADSVSSSSIYSYLNNLERYPDTDEFIQKLRELGPNHRINIDTINVTQSNEISHIQAAYNPRKDSIAIHFNIVPDFWTERRYTDGAEWRLLPWDSFNNEIRLFNSNILGALIHELKHRDNAHSYILLGFTISQIAQIYLHDEISARISEMLFRRQLFIRGGDLENAFTGQAYRIDSKLIIDDFTYGFGIYKNWLHKNSSGLSDIPTAEEASIVLQSATNMLHSEKAMQQYSIGIPRLVALSFRQINSFERYFDNPNPEITARGFDDAVRQVYKFGDINFFQILDDAGRANLFAFIKKFTNNKFYKRNMKTMFPYGYETVAEKQQEYAQRAGLSQSGEFDIENTNYFPIEISNNRRRER